MAYASKEAEAAADRSSETEHDLPAYGDVHDPKTRDTAPPPFASSSSSSILRTEHTYSLNNSKGRPWLTMKVKSRAPTAKALPYFLAGDEITGTVSVTLEKPESSKGVIIAATADNTAVGQEPIPFLNVSSQLWSPSGSTSKLFGSETWPFSLSLPSDTEVSDTPKGPKKTYPLPPTFTERASPAYIDYKIVVTVKRGAFRVNQTLSTSLLYVPRWKAPPPSPARLLAYNEGSALVGPDADPEGWKSLHAVRMTGSLFEARAVQVEYTLSIANPLTYATGSPIPLQLTITSSDQQALDLLSAPTAPSVLLTRVIAIGSDATDEDAPRRSNNTFMEHVAQAYWWSIQDIVAPEEGKRTLMGEIDVRKGLKPGFLFPRFSVRYQINMLPPSAAGFMNTSLPPTSNASFSTGLTPPLLTETVQIVTENADGVIPRSHAPPGYVRPAGEGNYNNSMGYLENGNQRFYHHHGFA